MIMQMILQTDLDRN